VDRDSDLIFEAYRRRLSPDPAVYVFDVEGKAYSKEEEQFEIAWTTFEGIHLNTPAVVVINTKPGHAWEVVEPDKKALMQAIFFHEPDFLVRLLDSKNNKKYQEVTLVDFTDHLYCVRMDNRQGPSRAQLELYTVKSGDLDVVERYWANVYNTLAPSPPPPPLPGQ